MFDHLVTGYWNWRFQSNISPHIQAGWKKYKIKPVEDYHMKNKCTVILTFPGKVGSRWLQVYSKLGAGKKVAGSSGNR